jgi:hypothetical protein
MTQDGDIVREMTAQEYADYQQLLVELEAQAAAADAKAAALASARKKLRDLLTDDEIAALLGE